MLYDAIGAPKLLFGATKFSLTHSHNFFDTIPPPFLSPPYPLTISLQRFLKALGYLTDPNRPASTDEEIQMHADTLFHRMLSQEAAIAKAKADSLPVPDFPSVLASTPVVPQSPSPLQAVAKEGEEVMLPPQFPRDPSKDYLNSDARQALNARLAKLSPKEREIEEYALEMEARHEVKVGREVGRIIDERERQRQERRERGTATTIDTISGWFKW